MYWVWGGWRKRRRAERIPREMRKNGKKILPEFWRKYKLICRVMTLNSDGLESLGETLMIAGSITRINNSSMTNLSSRLALRCVPLPHPSHVRKTTRKNIRQTFVETWAETKTLCFDIVTVKKHCPKLQRQQSIIISKLSPANALVLSRAEANSSRDHS